MRNLIEHGSNVHLQDKVLIFFFFLFIFSFLFVAITLAKILFMFMLIVLIKLVVLMCWICFVLFLTIFFLKYGVTALHGAASNGFKDIVQMIIEKGSNIDLQDHV